jgi:hypothetical protein
MVDLASLKPEEPAAAAEEITSLNFMDLPTLLAHLEDRSAEVKLAALQQAGAYNDEQVWERIEVLAMEKNDRVREEARKLLKRRYGDEAVADLSSATIGTRANIDLSTAALEVSRSKSGELEALDVTSADGSGTGPSGSSRAVRRSRPTRSTGAIDSQRGKKQPAPQGLDLPPWARGVALGVVILLAVIGLGKLALSGSSAPSGTDPEADRAASKLSQMTKAKDLGKFIGVAVQFSGKLVDAKDREGRYIVQSSNGNVAVQFVRPVSKPPAVGATVDVDGVLLGKTKEGYLLFRGRKIQGAGGA